MNRQQATIYDTLAHYGLSGIELSHIAERRAQAVERDRLARSVSRSSSIRHWLGETLTRAGTRLAGGQPSVAARDATRPSEVPLA